MQKLRGLRFLFPLLGLIPLSLPAGEPQGGVVTVTEENDMFVKTDRHYTQGFKFTQMFADETMPRFVSDAATGFPHLGLDPEARKLGFTFGQNIYTPSDIDNPNLIPKERPYAGWLYLGWIVQRRGVQGDIPALENFELNLGVIGPPALGQDAQTYVHKLWGIHLPRGWSNQLKTEPGLALRYVRMWRFRAEVSDLAADWIPQFGGSLGNVGTYAESGFSLRAGYNVPLDFGPQNIDAPNVAAGVARPKWGLFGFTGISGRAVGYNAFLDGNLFRHSHHVDKNIFVAEWKLGAALVLKRVEMSYTYVLRTREFKHQGQNDAFGSVSLSVRF
jgi:hypothetical protein